MLVRVLWFVECCYLYAAGWRYRRKFNWVPPKNYPFTRKDPYTHGHAVNAQKQIDRYPRRKT